MATTSLSMKLYILAINVRSLNTIVVNIWTRMGIGVHFEEQTFISYFYLQGPVQVSKKYNDCMTLSC
jgi:hypothetical protein